MSQTPPTLQQLCNDYLNTAHALVQAIEDYDRKELTTSAGRAKLAEVGLDSSQIEAKLQPRIKPLWQAHKAARDALRAAIQAIDATVA